MHQPREVHARDENALAHFIHRDGVFFAGTHLIIDLWQAERLEDIEHVEKTLRAAVEAAGATLLRLDVHRFPDNAGMSGVATLAESHMSIHTWPECGYAALDIFMCGNSDPYKAVPVLKRAFKPGNIQLSEIKRGLLP